MPTKCPKHGGAKVATRQLPNCGYVFTNSRRVASIDGGSHFVVDYAKNNSYYHRESDRHYTMHRKDGKFYQRRHQIGFDGRKRTSSKKR